MADNEKLQENIENAAGKKVTNLKNGCRKQREECENSKEVRTNTVSIKATITEVTMRMKATRKQVVL